MGWTKIDCVFNFSPSCSRRKNKLVTLSCCWSLFLWCTGLFTDRYANSLLHHSCDDHKQNACFNIKLQNSIFSYKYIYIWYVSIKQKLMKAALHENKTEYWQVLILMFYIYIYFLNWTRFLKVTGNLSSLLKLMVIKCNKYSPVLPPAFSKWMCTLLSVWC